MHSDAYEIGHKVGVGRVHGWQVLLAVVLTICGFAVAAGSAVAANFTWSGAAAVGEDKWSTAANWGGGTAPGGSVGTLTFPKLTSPACTAAPPTETCNNSRNDLTGLTVEAIAIDEDANYNLQGNEITLGSGGLSVTASEGIAGSATLPSIMLASPQTWSDDGGGTFRELHIAGNVSGAQTLQLDLSHRARVAVEGEVEVGALSIVGANGADTGAHAGENGYVEAADLNATDGSSVNLTDAELNHFSFASSYSVGPLTSTGGAIGVANVQPGRLTVNGGVTLDGASQISVGINKSGTIAGTDYSQVSASGPVTLAGELSLVGAESGGTSVCPTLHPGDADTLITATGALSGQFAGVPDGQLIPVTSGPVEGFEEVRPRCATARISYAAHSVTATIVSVTPPPRNVSPPSVSGNTWVGQTLTVHGGTFISEAEPGGYSGQYPAAWEDCDAAGNGCTVIEGAREPTYTLTAADLGHTIRVREDFYDIAGSAFATSSPTPVVTSSKPEPRPGPQLEPKSEAKPSPVLGSTVIARSLAGTVTVRLRGTRAFGPLTSTTVIPDESEVDATDGRLIITVATPAGKTVTAEVYGGRFRVHQASSGETHFILTLPLTGCPRVTLPHGSAAALARAGKRQSGPKSRHLWVSESGGSWGTNGRYVSTTVQGTTWLTLDECTESEVTVTAGKVKVLDLVRRKTKTVSAGHRYLAVATRRRHR